ncbi:ImmA/IrrE family metallo-endopeptidase [Anaerosporobacter sp.]|uniref:ImmA/IrrE family metallo-endopeptidase n=1 Tax=Anaerosporobacter sp. TaxID=1872529 RepID=UPI00286F96A9|nr:ImmA/IrrE family metallo-endopeptidase [Anaerosporobacter sp.]
MKFERFKKIIEYNHEHQNELAEKVRNFYLQMNFDYEKEVLNLMRIVKPLFNEKKYFVMEIPFKDREIGAICYKSDSFGYTFLNSALPKVKVNFALAHEIYHVLYQKDLAKKKVDIYISEQYLEQKEELSANLFAGILLMPTPSFTEMFRRFSNEQTVGDSYITIIAKLMSCFEVPYMSVVIRCYELGLLPDGETLQMLLDTDAKTIEEMFTQLWLNEEILYPTKRDNYKRLEQIVTDVGMRCVKEEILDDRTIEKVLKNMKKIYNEIRG